jgi:L-histidine Nalpha-methyltransferase
LGQVRRSPRMVCFLGSTIGNFTPKEFDLFLSEVTQALQPGEFFLLGVDLQKSKEILEPAYDDCQGITAAFNLNLLAHLNRKFAANFDLNNFQHQAFYNLKENQIEMHLQSLVDQTVSLVIAENIYQFDFQKGETIQTEISRKFNLAELCERLAAKGLIKKEAWTDENQWFGLILAQVN